MWICSCHAVTDGMIKEFAKQHGCAWKKLTQELKVGTQCGTCAKYAKEILEQAAGKPRRNRSKKRNADTSAETIANQTATSVPSPAAPSKTGSGTANSPTFLACGKCVCTCGK